MYQYSLDSIGMIQIGDRWSFIYESGLDREEDGLFIDRVVYR